LSFFGVHDKGVISEQVSSKFKKYVHPFITGESTGTCGKYKYIHTKHTARLWENGFCYVASIFKLYLWNHEWVFAE
jgi:hypothetical protein